ncbi:MAG: hypothetical protein M3N43_10150, partial [Actinomycetota bacterium]|nr:hypothetical protein [Actinomycetota bacterium]
MATAIAVAGVLVATLPPGPSTLSFLFFQVFEERDPRGIDGHLQAVSGALWKAEWEQNIARVRTALAPVGRVGASPIALHVAEGGTSAAVDTGLT